MNQLIQAAQQALAFLRGNCTHDDLCSVLCLDDDGKHYACTCGLTPATEALQAAIEQALTPGEPVAWQQELANILCRVHRDGGHYIVEHGWRKAIDDADLKVAHLNAASDAPQPQPVKEPLGYWNAVEGWVELPEEAHKPTT